jgi:hypothetical protein
VVVFATADPAMKGLLPRSAQEGVLPGGDGEGVPAGVRRDMMANTKFVQATRLREPAAFEVNAPINIVQLD